MLVLSLVAHVACARAPTRPSASLELGARIPRRFTARLSVATEYAPCAIVADTSLLVPHSTCGAADTDVEAAPSEVLERARQASGRLEHRPDIDAYRTAALVDLTWSADSGIVLDRSISYLRTASQLSAQPAASLADLAAAYLLRAERTQNVRDLLEAAETASLSLAVDANNQAAAFNHALALDQLELTAQADRAWTRYLAIDSTSPWASEARSRRARLRRAARSADSTEGSRHGDLLPLARGDPGHASAMAWNDLLALWADAEISGDNTTAARALRQVTHLGNVLVAEGADPSVAAAASAIRAKMPNRAKRRALARAHRDLARAQQLAAKADYTAALRWASQAAHDQAASPALRPRALLSFGAMLMYAGRMRRAERVVRGLRERTDMRHDPGLAGRVDWTLGTIYLRRGDYEAALAAYQRAIPYLKAIKEQENVGAVQSLAAEAAIRLGEYEAGYGYTIRAARTLGRWRSSLWRHSTFALAAMAASADGLPHAAADLADESVSAADANGLAGYRVESRVTAARFLADIGDTAGARAELALARTLVDSVPSGSVLRWLQGDLQLASSLAPSGGGARMIAAFDSAVTTFEALHVPLKVVPALLERADANFSLGRIARGRMDLTRALALLSQEKEHIGDTELRTSFLASARHVFDHAMLLDLASGNTRAALTTLETGRTALGSRPSATRTEWRLPSLPLGTVTLDYTVVGDTVLVWTVAGDSVLLTRLLVAPDHLRQLTDRVRATLEMGHDLPVTRSGLWELYQLILDPVMTRGASLIRGRAITIVADGELGAVPFAGLYDSTRGKYLAEEYPIRYAASVEDASVPRRPRNPGASMAIIADPAFDRNRYPLLDRLPGARNELALIADERPVAVALSGSMATARKAVRALHRAAIVHYAGHALYDDRHPMQSVLVLAPDAAAPRGTLAAGAIARMRLTNHPLVVLSACETMHPGSGHSGDVNGLTRAFLTAGARGVVGSQWRAGDRTTAALMVAFYRALDRSHDPARALQAAQLALIHSQDPALRAPSAWAAFRYVGQ